MLHGSFCFFASFYRKNDNGFYLLLFIDANLLYVDAELHELYLYFGIEVTYSLEVIRFLKAKRGVPDFFILAKHDFLKGH